MAVAAFVIACVLGLFAPLLVHVLAFRSLDDALRFLVRADGALVGQIGLAYIGALVVIAIFGGLYARGRRVPPLLLHVAAFVPLAWAIGGCVVRDRARVHMLDAFGLGRDNVTSFTYAVVKTESLLDVAATMSAFAMILVAFAALLRHESKRDGAGTLLVAVVSAGLCVATAVHAYGRYALFNSLVDDYGRERYVEVPHAMVVANVTRAIAMALLMVSIVTGVVMARRVRAPGGKSAFAFLVVAGLFLAVPKAIATRDDALFRVPNPSALPEGVHAPLTQWVWSSAPSNHEPRVVVLRDGSRHLDTREAELAPMTDADLDHHPLGCIVDRDATFGAFARAVPNDVKQPWSFAFYVQPAHPPDLSSEGTLAAFIVSTNTTADVRFADPEVLDEHYVFITLEDLTLRVWHESGPEIVTAGTDDPPAAIARRVAFATIRELFDYPIYIRPRADDTLARVWAIANDIYAVVHRDRHIAFTTHDRPDRAAYLRKRAAEFSF